MIRHIACTIAIPLLLGITPHDTALAADGKAQCPDGHSVSASTGSNSGTCENYTNKDGVKGVVCTDDNGNQGVANCAGYGSSAGSGTYSAKPVQQGSTSRPNAGAGIKKPTSFGAATTSGQPTGKVQPKDIPFIKEIDSASPMQSSSPGGGKPTTTTTPSALSTSPNILGGTSGAGSAATAGSKAKLPTSGTSTQGH